MAAQTATRGFRANNHRPYELLAFANSANVLVPSDVVAAVTDARRLEPGGGGVPDHDAEAKFWNAYGLLNSIKPAYDARRRYKRWFYVWLGVLLVFQLHYLAATLVSNGLQGIQKEWQQPDQGTPAEIAWQTQQRKARACAYYRIANGLLFWTQGLDGLCQDAVSAPDTPEATVEAQARRQTAMIRVSTIRDLIDFFATVFAGYILPLLYGVLGAYAFVLRKLSEPLDALNYAHEVQVNYTLRLQIGGLAGLAVGWFINGSQPIVGVGSLSPVALAFAAGFGSDLLFATLDKIVGAFTPAPASRTAVQTESTVGGVTMTTTMQRETHVAGAADDAAPAVPAAASAAPRGPVAMPAAA